MRARCRISIVPLQTWLSDMHKMSSYLRSKCKEHHFIQTENTPACSVNFDYIVSSSYLQSCTFCSSGTSGQGGGWVNMKPMGPSSLVIYFMTYFYTARGMTLGPLIRYCFELLYRFGTVNSKSFFGMYFLRIKWNYELTVHF